MTDETPNLAEAVAMPALSPARPGVFTTEWWMTLVATMAAATLPLVQAAPTVEHIVSVALAVLGALGYTAARTAIKKAALVAPARP